MSINQAVIQNITKTKLNSTKNKIYISDIDLHPNSIKIFKDYNIKYESLELVEIKYVLESTKYIRYIFQQSGFLLKLKGNLKISFIEFDFDNNSSPYRNYISIMNEFSLSLGKNFKLIKNNKNDLVRTLIFEKTSLSLPKNDNIDSWSFGLVYGGQNDNIVDGIIENINNLKIDNYEIIICGPYKVRNNINENIKVISDDELYVDSRIPIARKKNKIIRNATFNNLVLFHDRFSFSPDWFEKIKIFGNYFECICPKIVDENHKNNRVQDWIISSLNHFDFKNIFSKSMALSYDKWMPNWNINGGFILIKKHLIEDVMYNEKLHWGEAEDGNFCRRLDAYGVCPISYPELVMYTKTNRLKSNKEINNILIKYLLKIKISLHKIVSHFRRILIFKNYTKNQ